MALDGKLLARAREQLEHIHADNVAEHFLRQEKYTPVYRKLSASTPACARR